MHSYRRPPTLALVLFGIVVLASLAGAVWLGLFGWLMQDSFSANPPPPSDVRIGHGALAAIPVCLAIPWAAMWAYTRSPRWRGATVAVATFGATAAVATDRLVIR